MLGCTRTLPGKTPRGRWLWGYCLPLWGQKDCGSKMEDTLLYILLYSFEFLNMSTYIFAVKSKLVHKNFTSGSCPHESPSYFPRRMAGFHGVADPQQIPSKRQAPGTSGVVWPRPHTPVRCRSLHHLALPGPLWLPSQGMRNDSPAVGKWGGEVSV